MPLVTTSDKMTDFKGDFKNDFQNDYRNDFGANQATDIPPPSYTYASSTGNVYDVHYRSWRSNIFVTQEHSTEPLYTLSGRYCLSNRPCTITNNRTGQAIGTSKIHSMSSKIDIDMNLSKSETSHSFEIKNDKLMCIGSPRYTSPSFGDVVTWRNTALSAKIIYTLVGADGMGLARFESNRRTKIGRLEILSEAGMEEGRIEEVMVTLLTILRRKMAAIEAGYIAAIT